MEDRCFYLKNAVFITSDENDIIIDRTLNSEEKYLCPYISEHELNNFYMWLSGFPNLGWFDANEILPKKTPVAKLKTILIDGYEFTGFYDHYYKTWNLFNPIDRSYHSCKPTHWRERFPLPKELEEEYNEE